METKPKYADALKFYIADREKAREGVYKLFSSDYLVERLSNSLHVKKALGNYRSKNETLVAILDITSRQRHNTRGQNRALRYMLNELKEEIKKEEREIYNLAITARSVINSVLTQYSTQQQKNS